jgi:hypothetical protein
MMIYSRSGQVHEVWQTGEIPAICHLLPAQAAELEKLRRQAGKQ